MKQLNVQQNTPEWLEARKGYRTASEAAIVCGVLPFTTVLNFQKIKAGLKKQFYSTAMKRGHDMEDQARKLCDERLGRTFRDECWVRSDYMASLDGIDGDVLVEIKVSKWTYRDIMDGKIPDYYWLQIQQQLYCSPASVGYLAALDPDTGKLALSDPIAEDEQAMVRIEQAWLDFLALPPPVPDVDWTGDGVAIKLFERFATAKALAEEAKTTMDSIKAELIALSESRSGYCEAGKLTKKAGAKRTDYKKAASDAGLDLSGYVTEGKPSYAVTLPKAPFDALD